MFEQTARRVGLLVGIQAAGRGELGVVVVTAVLPGQKYVRISGRFYGLVFLRRRGQIGVCADGCFRASVRACSRYVAGARHKPSPPSQRTKL